MTTQTERYLLAILDELSCALLEAAPVDVREIVYTARRAVYATALALASEDLARSLRCTLLLDPRAVPQTAPAAWDRHVLACLSAHLGWLDRIFMASDNQIARVELHDAAPLVWWPCGRFEVGGAR